MTRLLGSLGPVKTPALWLVRSLNGFLRSLACWTHLLEYIFQWKIPPEPEWVSHFVDLYWHWPTRGGSLFLERGVFNLLVIEQGAAVLDLCCGDGFNSRRFYAERAARIVAVDDNEDALAYARRFNAAPQIEHRRLDITEGLPTGPFSNITWDAAIEHFSREAAIKILANAKEALTVNGVISGYTLIEQPSAQGYFVHHGQVFTRKEDLQDLLAEVFPHVVVLETQHPARTNLYFWASARAEALPFQPGFKGAAT